MSFKDKIVNYLRTETNKEDGIRFAVPKTILLVISLLTFVGIIINDPHRPEWVTILTYIVMCYGAVMFITILIARRFLKDK